MRSSATARVLQSPGPNISYSAEIADAIRDRDRNEGGDDIVPWGAGVVTGDF